MKTSAVGRPATILVVVLLLVTAASRSTPVLAPAQPGDGKDPFAAGFDTLTEAELLADLSLLAGPATEGRDSPSAGLTLAAEHIARRLADAGYVGAAQDGSFLLPFTHEYPAPEPDSCQLRLATDDGPGGFELGRDFVPVWMADGKATGELVVLGFGIDSRHEKYDDVTGDLKGAIAVISSGEPRHRKKFEGPELSAAADLYGKLETLRAAGVAGVLVVRRPPAALKPEASRRDRASDAPPRTNPPLGFRHSWARWVGDGQPGRPRDVGLPALEITPEAARELTGMDVLERLAEVDRRAKPPKPLHTERRVELAAASALTETTLFNVAGILEGADPERKHEFVVLGAHYDHLGVDTRGRVGHGADDNASGTSALLAVASALALARPRRSILACAFAGEEDGLLGSDALAEHPPVPRQDLVAMVNMDMLGYGDAKEVAVIGVPENPSFAKLLERARKLRKTGVRKLVTGQGQEVFKRSDHYSFHKRGVPSLFFFEGLPVGANPYYHTWHDTLDTLDLSKIEATARLVFNTVWLLAQDETRPPPPKHVR